MQGSTKRRVMKMLTSSAHTRDEARRSGADAGRPHRPAGGESDEAVVKSAQRVLQIFEYFDEICRPASTTEIARNLGYPLSSAAALLRTLTASSYLSYDEVSREYLPTVRIALLGGWVSDASYPTEGLKDLMTALHRETSLSVLLGIRNRIHVQYLHAIQGSTPIRYHVPSVSRRLLTQSTMGRVILSALPDTEVEFIVRHCNAVAGEDDERLPPRKLKSLLQGYRQQKYAYSRNFPTRGASLIAMLLPTVEAAPLLTIAIAGPNEYIDGKQRALVRTLNDLIRRHTDTGGGASGVSHPNERTIHGRHARPG